MSMTHTDVTLGSPPHSWSTLKADLIRLRRSLDCDDEEAAARHITSLHPDRVRIALIDKLLAHIEPAVADEAALWDSIDRDLEIAKERGVTYSLDQPRRPA
jgi:hypothetical protein